MPIYDFECEEGHTFEKILSITKRDIKVKCEECDKPAIRLTGTCTPPIVDPSRIMRNKPKLNSRFIQRMKDIKKHHPGNSIKDHWS